MVLLNLFFNFTETVLSTPVTFDIIFNFVTLISSIIAIILYRQYTTRMIISFIISFIWIGSLVTSILSFGYMLNGTKIKGILYFISISKLCLSFGSFFIGISDYEH